MVARNRLILSSEKAFKVEDFKIKIKYVVQTGIFSFSQFRIKSLNHFIFVSVQKTEE